MVLNCWTEHIKYFHTWGKHIINSVNTFNPGLWWINSDNFIYILETCAHGEWNLVHTVETYIKNFRKLKF